LRFDPESRIETQRFVEYATTSVATTAIDVVMCGGVLMKTYAR
jgi:hypothetical protein